jgi:hypothetical protein
VPVIGAGGAAVDYSHANQVKAAMQAAVDSTALTAKVILAGRDVDPELYRRYLAIVLDGLRARPDLTPPVIDVVAHEDGTAPATTFRYDGGLVDYVNHINSGGKTPLPFDFLFLPARQLLQFFRELDRGIVTLEGEQMAEGELAHLRAGDLDQFLVAVAERRAPEPGHAVDIRLAVAVVEPHTLTTLDHPEHRAVEAPVAVRRDHAARELHVPNDGRRHVDPDRVRQFEHDAELALDLEPQPEVEAELRLTALESANPAAHACDEPVTGELREGLDAVDLLRATFPGGSITGAPRRRGRRLRR